MEITAIKEAVEEHREELQLLLRRQMHPYQLNPQ